MTQTYYHLILNLIGNIPNSYHTDTFETPELAEAYWKENFRDRKVGDGNDDYWNKVPLMIQKVTKTTDNLWENPTNTPQNIQELINVLVDIGIDLEGSEEEYIAELRNHLEDCFESVVGSLFEAEEELKSFEKYALPNIESQEIKEDIIRAFKNFRGL